MGGWVGGGVRLRGCGGVWVCRCVCGCVCVGGCMHKCMCVSVSE